MKPTARSIDALTSSARFRVDRLVELAQTLGPTLDPADRRRLSYICIELSNAWGEYSRFFIYSCLFGASDSAGGRITPQRASGEEDALTIAIRIARPDLAGDSPPWRPSDHPDFKNPNVFQKILRALSASVLGDVDTALSVQTSAFEHVPIARNYFAHKGRDTARKVLNFAPSYGIVGAASPPDVLVATPAGGGDLLVREWLADMTAVLNLMP